MTVGSDISSGLGPTRLCEEVSRVPVFLSDSSLRVSDWPYAKGIVGLLLLVWFLLE